MYNPAAVGKEEGLGAGVLTSLGNKPQSQQPRYRTECLTSLGNKPSIPGTQI